MSLASLLIDAKPLPAAENPAIVEAVAAQMYEREVIRGRPLWWTEVDSHIQARWRSIARRKLATGTVPSKRDPRGVNK